MEKIPNEDTFGYCVKCGKRMIDHQVIDGIYKLRLSGEYTRVMMLLDDGSKMGIAMCRHCADAWGDNEDDKIEVMKKVFRGWQSEVNTYADWNEDKKKEYLDRYGKKRIVMKTDGIPGDVLEQKFMEYKKKEPKEKKNVLMEKPNGISIKKLHV